LIADDASSSPDIQMKQNLKQEGKTVRTEAHLSLQLGKQNWHCPGLIPAREVKLAYEYASIWTV
jgi:hypothetical protein